MSELQPSSRSGVPVSRESSVGDQLQTKGYLSPSDTSIDESVKSAQAGKDVSTPKKSHLNHIKSHQNRTFSCTQVLEQYLRKSKASLKSVSSGLGQPTTSNNDLADPTVGSPPPPLTLPTHYPYKSDYLVRPGASASSGGFCPYYTNNNSSSNHHLMMSSSPRYSTPPLPSDSMLGSPIPDYRHDQQPPQQHRMLYHYDHPGTQAQPTSQPLSLTSISPTSGVRKKNHTITT